MFPDMPVNSGLEKVLAVVTDGIAKAAQPLMSLSFLILPVSLAVGIKLFQWLGPFAAAAAVLIPLAGLFAAESILSERVILPLSGEALAPSTVGKAVRHYLSFLDAMPRVISCVWVRSGSCSALRQAGGARGCPSCEPWLQSAIHNL